MDPWGPQGASNDKVAEIKKCFKFYFSRGDFYEKMPNSKIFCATRPTRTFRPNLFRPRGKNQNSAPNILLASSSRFQKGMTRPPRIKNLGGDRFGRNPLFQGSGLTPRASGSKSPTRKLLARSFGDPENFMPICGLGQKLRTFVAVTDGQTHRRIDGQTDGRTDAQTDRHFGNVGIWMFFIKETPPQKKF